MEKPSTASLSKIVTVAVLGLARIAPPIGLESDGGNIIVSASAEIDRGVHRPVRIQAGEAIAREAIEGGESAAHQDLVVGLKGQRADKFVGPGSNAEGIVQAAVGIKAHDAADGRAVPTGEET